MLYLKSLAKEVVKKWLIVVCIVALALGGAGVFYLIGKDTYGAQVNVTVSRLVESAPNTKAEVNLTEVIEGYKLQVYEPAFLEKVLEEPFFEDKGMTVKKLKSMIKVEQPNPNVFSFKVSCFGYSQSDAEEVLKIITEKELPSIKQSGFLPAHQVQFGAVYFTEPVLKSLSKTLLLAGVAGIVLSLAIIIIPCLPGFSVYRKKDLEENFECVVLGVFEEERKND